jgi:curli production assembly/transport component CsgF
MRRGSQAASRRIALSSVFALALVAPALASTIIYTPVNPSFGGNALNSSHLLGVANAINEFKAPDAAAAKGGQSAGEQFVRQLESRLYSSLANSVTEAIFGENAQEHGEIVFGSQTITFDRDLDSVDVTIFDAATGETTRISVPLLTE